MRDIISFFPKETLNKAVSLFNNKKNVVFSGSGNSSSKAMVLSQILKNSNIDRNILWIVSDKSETNLVKKAVNVWSDKNVFVYRKREKEEIINFPSSRDFERVKNIETLDFISKFITQRNSVFILDFQSLLQKFPRKKELENLKTVIKKGEEIDVVKFIEKIVSIGYESTEDDYLEKGTYYRRGDSIFIKPVNNDDVLRIDIDFDNVQKINIVSNLDYTKTIKEEEKLELFQCDIEEADEEILSFLNENDIVIDDEGELDNVPNDLKQEAKDAARLLAIRDKFPDNHKLEEIIANYIHHPDKNGPKIKAFLESTRGKRFLQEIKRRNKKEIEINEDIVNQSTTSYSPTVIDKGNSKFNFVKCENDNGYSILK